LILKLIKMIITREEKTIRPDFIRDHKAIQIKRGNSSAIIKIEAIRTKQMNEINKAIGVIDFRNERKVNKNRKGKR